MEITYRETAEGILLPNLTPPKWKQLSKWGNERLYYLETMKPREYQRLNLKGTLNEHCLFIEDQAVKMESNLTHFLKEKRGYEKLLRQDWLKGVQLAYQIKAEVDERIRAELINQ